jgi:hypothetical protein
MPLTAPAAPIAGELQPVSPGPAADESAGGSIDENGGGASWPPVVNALGLIGQEIARELEN